MSQAAEKQHAPYALAIADAKERFFKVNSAQLDYQAEALFALQVCQNNQFLADVANQNPLSLRMAVANVAAIGLSLNPALGYAFLVPRDGKVILDVSYRGLIKIATDIGSIKWAKAELVYERDRFRYRGPAQMPEHKCDPFEEDRGEFRGAYCIARTPDGEVLVETIKASELDNIRDCSAAYTKSKSGPWVSFPGEMCKKSCIKRASKTWPKTPQDNRLAEALRILNEDNGEGLADLANGKPGESSTIILEPQGRVPTDAEVSEEVRRLTQTVIERARKAGGAWAAAKTYVNERLTGLELNYALAVIQREEQKAAASEGGA
ncbi:MAG: recombinase RecT [Sulfuricaulis sp.]